MKIPMKIPSKNLLCYIDSCGIRNTITKEKSIFQFWLVMSSRLEARGSIVQKYHAYLYIQVSRIANQSTVPNLRHARTHSECHYIYRCYKFHNSETPCRDLHQ